MKKNLLFVMPSLASGGGERSLINLLGSIDYSRYNVDLFLLHHEGLFMDLVPKNVRILPLPEEYRLFSKPLVSSMAGLVARGKPGMAYHRLLFSMKNRLPGNASVREQYSWRHLSRAFKTLSRRYDTAIGFLEKTSTYFCVEKVEADKKIGWVHIDYDKLGMDPDFDVRYFDQLDHLVTVSEECAAVLRNRFPEQHHKVSVIHNIISPSIVRRMAKERSDAVSKKHQDEIVLVSIGRLHYQKGFELAVEACKILTERGYRIQWNIIGEGEERAKLARMIEEYQLTDRIRLLGLKSNPYPYIQYADIYVQTSRFEGKSIAIDEAKILNKPIVVTRFSTAKDQINDGVDGLIVDMNPPAIASGIERLINDRTLRRAMTEALARIDLGTEDEIYKLYKLIG